MNGMMKKMIIFKVFICGLFIVSNVVFGMEDGSQHYDSTVDQDSIYVADYSFKGWRRLDTKGFAKDVIFSIMQDEMRLEDKNLLTKYKINKRYSNCCLKQLKDDTWCIQDENQKKMAKLDWTDDQFKRLRTLRLDKNCVVMADNKNNLFGIKTIEFFGQHKLVDYYLLPINQNIQFCIQDEAAEFEINPTKFNLTQNINKKMSEDGSYFERNFVSKFFRTMLFYGSMIGCALIVAYYFIKPNNVIF
jgi:hypothetical protein